MNNNYNYSFILPNYLIKYILKLICIHINYKNEKRKLYDHNKLDHDAKEKERPFKVKLALVCWDWFNCISRNLNVSIDFKYYNNNDIEKNRYIILQNKNIEVLKLVHYDNLDPNYEQQLKIKLSQFKNLKKIIICRRYILKDLVRHPQTFTFDFLNRVFNGINTYTPIKVNLQFALYCNCFGFIEVPRQRCSFKVNKIQIDSCCEDPHVIFNYLEYFNPKHINIVPMNIECHFNNAHLYLKQLDKWMLNKNNHNNDNNIIAHTTYNRINYLEHLNIDSFEINDSFTVKELFYLFYYIPHIKQLSIGICLIKLIKQFNKYENQINNTQQQHNNNNIKYGFTYYWNLLRKIIISNNNLIHLVLHNKCSYTRCCNNKIINLNNIENNTHQQQQNNNNNNNKDKQQTPIKLIQQISEIFELNSSIKLLKLINFNSDIVQHIYHNNTIINYTQKDI